ncbi:MAG TPA: hypothetical protein VN132_15105 [Bdellovibrio sp.]|nr:hypothetical protein [Bdellovibrio sp.]
MKAFVAILALAICSTAGAGLKETKQLKEWNDYLKDPSKSYSQTFKDKCGYNMDVTLDEKFVTPFLADNSNAASFCDTPRSVMAGMCADATSKQAITKDVKKIACKYSSEKAKLEFKLDKKTKVLEMTVGVGAANIDTVAKTYLENNL